MTDVDFFLLGVFAGICGILIVQGVCWLGLEWRAYLRERKG